MPSAGGYNVNQSIAPGDTNAPVIFEAPNAMTAPALELWVAASGGKGLRSLKVTLAGGATDEVSYTLRLHFAECDGLPAGERVFSVSLQGQLAAKDLDIAKEAGGPNKALVKEFKGVKVKDALRMDLTPAEHSKLKAPLLCGVEIIAETEGRK